MTQGYVPARRFPDAPPLSPDNPGRLIPATFGQLPGALPGRAGVPGQAAPARSVAKIVRETVPATTAQLTSLVNGLPFGNRTPPPGAPELAAIAASAPSAIVPPAPVTPPGPAAPPPPVTPPGPITPPVVVPPATLEAMRDDSGPHPPARVLTPPPGLAAGLVVPVANGSGKPTPPMGVEPMPAPPAFVGEPAPPAFVGEPAPPQIIGAPTIDAPRPVDPPRSDPAAAPPPVAVSPWMREAGQPSFQPEPRPMPEPVALPVSAAPVPPRPSSSSKLPIFILLGVLIAAGAGVAAYFTLAAKRPGRPASEKSQPSAVAPAPPETAAEPAATDTPSTESSAPSPTGETLKSPPPPPPTRPYGPVPTSTAKQPATPPQGGQKFDPSGI